MEMTVQLRIDGRPCDLGPGPCAVPGYSAARTSDPDACREGRRMQLAIPPTPRNRTRLGDPRDPHTGSRFNAALHTATITAEDAVLLEGTVRLLAASDEAFTLEIRDGGAGWAERAARRAKDAEWAVQCLSAPWENFLKEWDAQGVFEGGPPPPDRSSLKPWRKSISRAFIDWSVGARENLAPLLRQSPVPQLLVLHRNNILCPFFPYVQPHRIS